MPGKTKTQAEVLFEQFQAFLDMQKKPVSPAATSRKRTSGKSSAPRISKANTRTTGATIAAQPSKRTPKGVITCEQAWTALGADPTFKPSRPNDPARNGQLWALNAAGKLRLV